MTEVFEPLIAAQVAWVREFRDLDFKIEDVRKGSENAKYADRFTLVVPCCFERIRWQIIFKAAYPTLAPDFVFPAENETFQPLLVMPEIPAAASGKVGLLGLLRDWNVRDSARLLRLVLQLRYLYLWHQRKLVERIENQRVRFEINSIGAWEGLEICLVGPEDRPEEVQLAIPMVDVDLHPLLDLRPRLDLPGMESLMQELNPLVPYQNIILQVKFPLNKASTSSLLPAPQFKVALPVNIREMMDTADIPFQPWTESECLMAYLINLQDQLKDNVKEARMAMDYRRQFIEAIPKVFGHPLEAETVYFRRFTIVACIHVFTFLAHFTLPAAFPKVPPSFYLQSTQHFDNSSKPLRSRLYDDFPYSPRWDMDEMVRRIAMFMQDEATAFKKQCQDFAKK
ncbi:hypothetical protein CBR_g23034 [Chara braunii]|uniref:BRISC and BRCA1-A complex member 2 n=1 Tax=Chara braunii TaxID=69332 RepID=A0A388L3C5_CHABU|nr:hypothetical protein CBR_g23034 [Chara braunii]|eukprot:GBG76819.1 hypothetical protein CBR_g23034 [Chara braunii]